MAIRSISARALLGALSAFVLIQIIAVSSAQARVPTNQFSGDRWVAQHVTALAWGGMGPDTIKAIRVGRKGKAKSKAKRSRRAPAYAAPLTLAQGARREVTRAFGQPSFVRGRLICAVNVNRALAARGIKGTGSALAMSYRNWGRASGPVPGAVAVFSRGRTGGHVAIVDHVKPDGTVIYLNPSARRQAWVVGPYHRRPLAYRVAS